VGTLLRQRLAGAALLAAGVTLAVMGTRVRRQGPRVAAPSASAAEREPRKLREPGEAELRLLAPLVVGSNLGGFKVREIHGVDGGVLRLSCARGREVVRLDVALAGDAPDGGEGPLPPATAGRYAIFYGLLGAAPEDGERLALLLGRVIGKHADVPVPPGMTTFEPSPRPAMTL
jgi:hypothetical protein